MITPDVNTESTQSGGRWLAKLKNKQLLIIAALVIGVLVLIFGLNQAKNSSTSYTYKYKNLDNASLKSPTASGKISFSKPVEFKAAAKPTDKLSLVQSKKSLNIGGINTTVIDLPAVSAASDTAYFAKQNSPKPDKVVYIMDTVANQALDSKYSVHSSNPGYFKTTNISSVAWREDFTASAKDANQADNLPPLQGTTVFAVGKASYYYFMVYSLSTNWQSNSAIWQQVLNSIKIDQ